MFGSRILGATVLEADWEVYIVDEDDDGDEEDGGTTYRISFYSIDEDSLIEDSYVSESFPDRIHTKNCCSLITRSTSLFSEDEMLQLFGE